MPTDNTPQEEVTPQRVVDMSNLFTNFDASELLNKLRGMDVLNAHSDKIVRLVRNQLLSYTDWTQTVDAPLAPEVKQAFADYRQQLRDLTAHPDYPLSVTLPTMPPTK